MCENRADSIRLLERLARQIMKEEDPLKFDELGEKILRVLDERERVGATPSSRTFDLSSGELVCHTDTIPWKTSWRA